MLVIAGLKGVFGFLETILKVVPFIANIFGFRAKKMYEIQNVAEREVPNA